MLHCSILKKVNDEQRTTNNKQQTHLKIGPSQQQYLEDILHPPEVPDDDHDGWDHSLNWILSEVSKNI